MNFERERLEALARATPTATTRDAETPRLEREAVARLALAAVPELSEATGLLRSELNRRFSLIQDAARRRVAEVRDTLSGAPRLPEQAWAAQEGQGVS